MLFYLGMATSLEEGKLRLKIVLYPACAEVSGGGMKVYIQRIFFHII